MLTVIVRSRPGRPEALAATLSSLVPAVAEGLLAHALVLEGQPERDVARIVDAMGADLMTQAGAGWREAAKRATSPWSLLLDAGETPDPGWVLVAERHLMVQSAGNPRAGLMVLADIGGLMREGLSLMIAARSPRPGLLAPTADIAAGQLRRLPVRLSARRQGYRP
jgi:hypothetical protein